MPGYKHGESRTELRPAVEGERPPAVRAEPEKPQAPKSDNTESQLNFEAAQPNPPVTWQRPAPVQLFEVSMDGWREGVFCETEEGQAVFTDPTQSEEAKQACEGCPSLPKCTTQMVLLHDNPGLLPPELREHLETFKVLAGKTALESEVYLDRVRGLANED